MNWLRLLIVMMWAVTGAVATRYYGKSVKEVDDDMFNPLPFYAGWCYILAGIELAKFVG